MRRSFMYTKSWVHYAKMAWLRLYSKSQSEDGMRSDGSRAKLLSGVGNFVRNPVAHLADAGHEHNSDGRL